MDSSSTIAGLPVPTQEKVTRWLSHGVVVAIGVTAIITFMPYINKALDLLLNGLMSGLEIAAIVGGALVVGAAALAFWPVYKRIIESLANKATWAVLEFDPITPMVLWLQEIKKASVELQQQYGNICAVIAQNMQAVTSNRQAAAKAQKLFEAAVISHGADSPEAHLLSIKPGSCTDTANSIEQSTQQLYEIRDILKQVVDAGEFTVQKAEADIDAAKQQYAAAVASEGALNSATRVLRSNSQRKQDATSSMKIIHDKYAGNFGRLQSLQTLSQTLIANVGAEKDASYQDALSKLRSESRMITGGASDNTVDAHFTPSVGAIPNGSFYTVSSSKPV